MKTFLLAALVAMPSALPATVEKQQAPAATLVVPFDFSRGAIEVDIVVRGTPLHALVDTGVNPSVIALSRALELGLPVDRGDEGEASGFGNGKGAAVFPSAIDGLSLGGRPVARFDAVAADLSSLSARYGRPLDAILGTSFLGDKRVLIDYPRRSLSILPAGSAVAASACRRQWSAPLRLFDESYPLVADFRIGATTMPATLDTGYNGAVALFGPATDLPDVRAALVEAGSVEHAGARGSATSVRYVLALPVGLGPFTLPAGQAAIVHAAGDHADGRAANLGNRLLDAMQLRVLLDYPAGTLTLFGDCR